MRDSENSQAFFFFLRGLSWSLGFADVSPMFLVCP